MPLSRPRRRLALQEERRRSNGLFDLPGNGMPDDPELNTGAPSAVTSYEPQARLPGSDSPFSMGAPGMGGPGMNGTSGGDGQPARQSSQRSQSSNVRLELEAPAFNRERPELNKRKQRRDKILSLAGAAATAVGALADAPGLAVTGAGLSQGFSENVARRNQAFMQELADYRDARDDTMQRRTELTNEERRENFEADRNREQAQRDQQQALERLQTEEELERETTEFERGLPMTEQEERELDAEERRARANETRAGASQTRANAALMRARQAGRGSGSGSSEADPEAPTTMQDIDEEIDALRTYLEYGIQEANSFGERYRREPTPGEQSDIRDRIRMLQNAREDMQQSGNARDSGESEPSAMQQRRDRMGAQGPNEPNFMSPAQQAMQGSQSQGNQSQGSQAPATEEGETPQGDQAMEMRRSLLQGMQNEADPAQIMDMAQAAYNARALSRQEYQQILNRYGQ